MDNHLFWLTEEPFAPLEPRLPTDTRGKARVPCVELNLAPMRVRPRRLA
jgi:hypothetical protein